MSLFNKKHTCILSGAFLALAFAMSSHATVVTFEDIDPANLSDGYGGVSGWTSTGSIFSGIGEGVGNYLFYGQSGMLSFDGAPVVFQGTYYKSYAVPSDESPITAIELYYQGNLVHSILDPLAPMGLEWVASGYSGLVDKVFFRGGIEGFAIDNLTYEPGNVSQVPLPASGILVSAVGIIYGLRRRFFNVAK